MWKLTKGNTFLPTVSLKKIQKMYDKEKTAKSKLRLLSAVHRKRGKSIDEIASLLSKPRRTIHGWLTQFQKRGINGKDSIKQSGRPATLTLTQRKNLVKDLERGPPHNISGLWSTKELRDLLKRKYSAEFVNQHVWRMLVSSGFSMQRPRKRHYQKPNEEEIALFKKKARRKAKYHRERGFVVGTQDEATFGLIPIIMRGRARRGSHPAVKINHKNECTNVFGARSARSFIYFFRKRKRQKQFIEFLEKLRQRWGKYLLFVDGAKAHGGAKVRAYLKKHRKTIKLEYFPKCSPEENPTEQCWKPGRNALANRVIPSLNAAKYHLRKTFDNTKAMPKMFHYLRD